MFFRKKPCNFKPRKIIDKIFIVRNATKMFSSHKADMTAVHNGIQVF